MRRRDILKCVGLGLSAASMRSFSDAQAPPRTFLFPTARFSVERAYRKDYKSPKQLRSPNVPRSAALATPSTSALSGPEGSNADMD